MAYIIVKCYKQEGLVATYLASMEKNEGVAAWVALPG